MRRIFLALAATIFFIAILLATYWLHVRFFDVDVVFYAVLEDVAVATLIASCALLFVPALRDFSGLEKLQLIAIWLLGGYAFAISIPTVIDRSLSFYILEKLDQRGGGIRQDAFAAIFAGEFMREHRLVDVRLTEQLESGTIVLQDGCVRLTRKGHRIASLSRYFRNHFLPKRRLLMGEYSDDLVDPFERSDQDPGYLCPPR
jgi:hypothetical protein